MTTDIFTSIDNAIAVGIMVGLARFKSSVTGNPRNSLDYWEIPLFVLMNKPAPSFSGANLVVRR